MGEYRMERVKAFLMEEISMMIFRGDVKDHRVSNMINISQVKVSKDLSYAKVFVSGFLGDQALERSVRGLNSAAGFIQAQLGKKMRTRNTPKLTFVADHSIEQGFEVNRKIDQL